MAQKVEVCSVEKTWPMGEFLWSRVLQKALLIIFNPDLSIVNDKNWNHSEEFLGMMGKTAKLYRSVILWLIP